MARARVHSKAEQLADLCVHVLGLMVAVAGTIVLAVLALDSAGKLAAVMVYAGGLLAMLGASAAYNVGYDTRFRALFRRFDHSAIFLMIAGTYTPFTTSFFSGWAAAGLTALIWGLSLAGIVLKKHRAPPV